MSAEPVTVARWRRTVPSTAVWRAWLHDVYDGNDGMAEMIDRGDLDAIGASMPPTTRTQADYLSEIIPAIAGALAAVRCERATTAEIARVLNVSPRTVRRHRTD